MLQWSRTHASTEPFVHTDGEFPKGPIDRLVVTEYVDHMTCRLWQRERGIYILCLILINLLLFHNVLIFFKFDCYRTAFP